MDSPTNLAPPPFVARPGMIERLRRRLSLRTQFGALLALLIFLVSALVAGMIGQNSADQARARIGQSLTSDAARIAEEFNKEMAARSRELFLLGAVDPLRNLRDRGEVQALLQALRSSAPAFTWLAITDTQGLVLAATEPALVGTEGSRSATQVGSRFATPLAGGPSPSLPNRPMTLSHPIRAPDGSVQMLLVAELSWAWLRDLMDQQISPDENGRSAREPVLVSAQDIVLLGPPGMVGSRLVLPAINRARAGFLDWSVETWPDGRQYLTGTGFAAGEGPHPGPGSQEMRWTVLVREPIDIAFAPASALRGVILLSGIGLGFAFAVLGWLAAGRITAPLQRIAAAADRLRQGEEQELPVITSPREIAALSASLRALVDSLVHKEQALDAAERLATRDPLTGLFNRNGLHRYLRLLAEQARGEGASLMLFVGDLDGFKGVNDTLGHGAGDILLRHVATRMTHHLRALDMAARMGGDEFLVVLHAPAGPTDAAAIATLEEIWHSVVAPYDLDGTPARVGLSLGGAVWPDDDRTLEGAIEKADTALYAAKRAGKNRVEMYLPGAAGA